MALIIAGIAGVTLGSYLLMTQQQNVSIYRSQVWNTSMVISEAGIEDGLQLINRNAGTFDPEELFMWTNTAAAEGWDRPAPNVYHVKRFMNEHVTSGTQVNSYEVWIYNTNNSPMVFAVGKVPWTYITASVAPPQPQPLLAVTGFETPPSPSVVSLARNGCHGQDRLERKQHRFG